MWANRMKTGTTTLGTNMYFEIRIKLCRNLAPHNVTWCFHNDSRNARVNVMHAILQWNFGLCVEISSRNIKS